MPTPDASPGRRLGAALAVAALHGVAWLAWPTTPAPAPDRATSAPTWLRLVPSGGPDDRPAARQPIASHRLVVPRRAPASTTVLPDAAPAVPAHTDTLDDVPPTATASASAADSPSPPRTALDLTLPGRTDRPGSTPGADATRATRQQALRDPRANSAPPRATDGLAALAGERVARSETPMAGEGRSRIVLRGRCFDVHAARIAQLDPFNESVRPTPKQVRPCD